MARTITHKITEDETTPAMFGAVEHLEYVKSHTFTQMVFEMLTERVPTEGETRLLDLILTLSIDHGPHSPSASKTIEEAQKGADMGQAVGEGIEQINERHGGAGEPLMEALYQIQGSKMTVQSYVENSLREGKRIPGLGHRVYKDTDPRAELIMETAKQQGVGVGFINIVREIRDELDRQSGKRLPVNIDGAIAAVLCGFGLKPEVGIAAFIIARSAGLCGHYINNSQSQKN